MTEKKKIDFVIDPETNCFNCVSHNPESKTYSAFMLNRKSRLVHRHIYEQCFGEIPDALCVCHKCDNPKCINPEHLFLGTINDNVKDMVEKNRQAKGEKNSSAKLKEQDITKIRKLYKKGLSTRKLAKLFNVGKSTIFCVVSKKTWGWV
jgi:DNA-binding transcriptional regulator YiaG